MKVNLRNVVLFCLLFFWGIVECVMIYILANGRTASDSTTNIIRC